MKNMKTKFMGDRNGARIDEIIIHDTGSDKGATFWRVVKDLKDPKVKKSARPEDPLTLYGVSPMGGCFDP